jgi:hypothetical protein
MTCEVPDLSGFLCTLDISDEETWEQITMARRPFEFFWMT